MGKLVDLTNQFFGEWRVLERDKERKGTAVYWKCQCSCGVIKSLRGNDLTSGHSKSCGHLKEKIKKEKKPRHKDYTGMTFGYLTVLEEDKERYSPGKIYWKCQCKCGNICSKRSDSFLSVEVPSCGCHKKERTSEFHSANLLNKRFGKLLVIEKVRKEDTLRNFWKCQCDCGNEVIYPSRYLMSMGVTSCGCDTRSYGELEIRQKLQKLNLEFKEQYIFSDCCDKKPLKFDFALLKDNVPYLLIEFQGKQHYEVIEYFGGEQRYLIQQEHDRIKREYCEKNNIPLCCIPYTQLGKIDIKDIINKYAPHY